MPDDRPQPWTVLERRTLVADRWISLHAERVRTGRGVILDPFYVLDESSWACAVPVLPGGGVVLVEQYRHGAGVLTLELPAGDLDPGEDPAAAAVRELAEETGYVANGAAIRLGALHPEPSRNRSSGQCFLIRVHPEPVPARTEASEDIRVVVLEREAVWQAVDEGRITHAVHVAALLLAHRRGLW